MVISDILLVAVVVILAQRHGRVIVIPLDRTTPSALVAATTW